MDNASIEIAKIKRKDKERRRCVCQKCTHEWIRKMDIPNQCPSCQSYDWKKEVNQNE